MTMSISILMLLLSITFLFGTITCLLGVAKGRREEQRFWISVMDNGHERVKL